MAHEKLFSICQRLNEIKEERMTCPDCTGYVCPKHEEDFYNTVDKIHIYMKEKSD